MATPCCAISWVARIVFTPKEALERVLVHREIFFDEMVDLMRQVMRGEVSPVMTAALLTGLRVKKETIGEIAAAAFRCCGAPLIRFRPGP